MPPELLDAVRRHLQAEFPQAELQVSEHGTLHEPVFTLQQDTLSYSLRLSSDFVEQHRAEDVTALLQSWKLREELCRAEGMPLVATARGLRLESAN